METPTQPHKKRKVERREKLRKSAMCKHYDKPGGCPFPDCRFAHGQSEVQDVGLLSMAAQRQLLRHQSERRADALTLHTEQKRRTHVNGNENSNVVRLGTMVSGKFLC